MPKPEQVQEPSIEEILASIRRIIADDAPAAGSAEVTALDDKPSPQQYGRRPKPSDSPAPRLIEDEVLELTEDFMLADEAASAALSKPAEPLEGGVASRDEMDGEQTTYSDPYDESFARRAGGSGPMVPAPQENNNNAESEGMFSAVMAEVQRFAGGGQMKDRAERVSSPDDNWGQPDVEALTPQSSPKTSARPVWSRRMEVDGERTPVEAPTSRPASPEPASARKADPASRDDWGRGAQAPVSDGGPAISFPSEEGFDPHPKGDSPFSSPSAQRGSSHAPVTLRAPDEAPAAKEPVAPAPKVPAPPALAPKAPAPADVQDKAEELAEKAVADFTSDRLSAPPVVADILKGDKPLMDAIKTSLVNALSRDPEEPDEFEEAPHPEDFADDLFGATEHPLSAALEPLTAGKVDRPNPVVATFADGFMALRPVVATSREASGADQEIPELPREDVDDIVAANEAVSVDRPAERSIAPAEPVMSNVSVVTSSVVTRPVAAAERFQSLSAPKSLEDTIKEMLRPLLMQWLDENMPRIVNEALREEIATKGLLPSARDQRR